MTPRARTLLAGLGLIGLTNAIALGNAAYNRSGEPDARVELSERELPVGWTDFERDNSGITLKLQFRALQAPVRGQAPFAQSFCQYRCRPEWLTDAKLESFGFSPPPRPEPGESGWHGADQVRDIFVVLEFNGAAYQRSLQLAQQNADAAPPDTPNQQPATSRRQAALEQLKWERETYSRLFAIDAGLDPAALRAQYPDRAHMIIARARLHLSGDWQYDDGYGAGLGELDNGSVQVPVEFREVFKGALPNLPFLPHDARGEGYAVTLQFGRHYEPWIVAASRGAPAAAPAPGAR